MHRFLQSNLTLVASFITLCLVILGFYFQQHPPQIAGIFHSQKPGVIMLNTPEVIKLKQPFVLSVDINTNKQPVNAVGLYLRFDPDRLQVLDFDTTQSFCQFYPEKKFDNNYGTVSLACGSPHPGVSGENTIVKIKFIPLLVGQSLITVDKQSQLLKSDGKGTNVLEQLPQKSINVLTDL